MLTYEMRMLSRRLTRPESFCTSATRKDQHQYTGPLKPGLKELKLKFGDILGKVGYDKGKI